MSYLIAVLAGDGIGPEIVPQAVRVLKEAANRFELSLSFQEALVGGCAYDATSHPLPPETLDLCRRADAVLLGAVGGPKWDTVQPPSLRPEVGALLPLRKHLGLYANLRPARLFQALESASPLRPEVIADGLDILVVRELTGGIYFGTPKERTGNSAVDTCRYLVSEVERIAHIGFRAAMSRNRRLCSVNKANVLETSRLWRETVTRLSAEYPEVELSHMLVDTCAMQLVRNPRQFNVIVTENMFGDILSDEAAMLTGSLGMLPSASLGGGRKGLYEPIHGSAPDIAGKDVANPLATILSAAMLIRHSLGADEAAAAIETAVERILAAGHRTADIAGPNEKTIGTREMGDNVLKAVQSQRPNDPTTRL